MLRGMTARDFQTWIAYHELEPFGPERDDYRTASIVQAIANVHRAKGRSARPVQDFLLKFGEGIAKPAKTWQEMKAIGMAIAGVKPGGARTK